MMQDTRFKLPGHEGIVRYKFPVGLTQNRELLDLVVQIASLFQSPIIMKEPDPYKAFAMVAGCSLSAAAIGVDKNHFFPFMVLVNEIAKQIFLENELPPILHTTPNTKQ